MTSCFPIGVVLRVIFLSCPWLVVSVTWTCWVTEKNLLPMCSGRNCELFDYSQVDKVSHCT